METPIMASVSRRLSPRRWAVLLLFVCYSASNAFQWSQLVIITNILEKYYDVSTLAISWTSIIYMLTYIPLIFPASWFLQKKGLRLSVLLGMLGTCTGSWLKALATSRSLFPLLFLGQTIVAISQVFILGMPAQLAATWFPQDQVSSACAVGVFGNQLGIALGFVVPSMLVKNQELEEDYYLIQQGLLAMFVAVALFTTVLLIAIAIFFEDKPPNPPSTAQEVSDQMHVLSEDNNEISGGFAGSLGRLAGNRDFVLLLLSYGINVGVFYAISTHLNTVITAHFDNAEEDAGRIGLIIVLCGMLGSMVCGFVLDKTHAFKLVTLIVYFLSFAFMLVYAFSLASGSLLLVYVAASSLGFFMTGYLPLGFEFGAEITFPEPEGTSSGLLNAAVQVFGIACTVGVDELLSRFDTDRVANLAMVLALAVGTGLTALVRPRYRRREAAANVERKKDDKNVHNSRNVHTSKF